MSMPTRMRMSRVGWLRLAVVVGAVGLLELCCRTGLIDRRVVIPPSQMADALIRLLISGQANEQILSTFGVILAAIVIAVIGGFILGVVIHALPRLRQALDPFFATYYAVPIFIFYPAMIPIFGLSAIPIMLMGVLTAIVAMVIATLNGLDRVPRVLTKVARVHRLGGIATALQLKLPAAAPHLFTGVKLAVSYAFIGVIASEFIMAPSGLGRLISDAYSDFNNRRMYALMLLLVVVATAVNMVLHLFDQRWAERRGIGKP
jgi:NitT/TauT family transport system permease protein